MVVADQLVCLLAAAPCGRMGLGYSVLWMVWKYLAGRSR